MSRPRLFFFHYNKPASKAAGKAKLSVFQGKVCHVVDNLVCDVPTWGKIRSKKQPHFVMAGRGYVSVRDGVAYITPLPVFPPHEVNRLLTEEAARIGPQMAAVALTKSPFLRLLPPGHFPTSTN